MSPSTSSVPTSSLNPSTELWFSSPKECSLIQKSFHSSTRAVVFAILLAGTLLAQTNAKPDPEPGIPVTDPLVIARCGACHTRDERGNMQRISWARSTPEGWQDIVKRMVLEYNAPLTQADALPIVKYLSNSHGLAPAESKPVMYYIERRVHDESGGGDDPMHAVCGKCHSISKALAWRRSAADWKQYAATHAVIYKFRPNDLAVLILTQTAPLHTPEWDAWSARPAQADFTGRWLMTASIPGRGKYFRRDASRFDRSRLHHARKPDFGQRRIEIASHGPRRDLWRQCLARPFRRQSSRGRRVRSGQLIQRSTRSDDGLRLII